MENQYGSIKRRQRRTGKALLLMCGILSLFLASSCKAPEMKETIHTIKEREIPYQEVRLEEQAFQNKYYYSQATQEQKVLYQEIVQGIMDGVEEITIHTGDPEAANQVFRYILCDYPEFFWCSGQATATGYGESLSQAAYCVFEPEYIYTGEEKERREQEIEAAAGECLAKAPQDASEYEKIRFIYEYLINTVDYQLDAPDNQNIYSALVNRVSVCAGYARATQYLLEKMGIFCTYVTGTTMDSEGNEGAHAWNIVRCDGAYYYVDTTWGDPVFQQETESMAQREMTYDYLCCTEAEICKTHTIKETVPYPECVSENYNYYRLNGMYYDHFDYDAFMNMIRNDIERGDHCTIFKFSDETVYAQGHDLLVGTMVEEGAQYLAQIYGKDQVWYSYEEDPLLNKIVLYWIYE